MRLYVAILLAALAALAAVLLGLWWAPFPVCVLLGALEGRARLTVPVSLLVGLGSWLVPMAVANVRYGLGATASTLAAIMGFGHQGFLPVVLTLLVGTLLGGTGAWLGSAARGLVAPGARPDAAAGR
jgi:hypothetical protein